MTFLGFTCCIFTLQQSAFADDNKLFARIQYNFIAKCQYNCARNVLQ